jgi:asparagine synthase (glutamine-hydrolysing)
LAKPIKQWRKASMNTYLKCLLSRNSAAAKYFNTEYVQTLLKLHLENREEYLRQLYLLVSFELWHRTFL